MTPPKPWGLSSIYRASYQICLLHYVSMSTQPHQTLPNTGFPINKHSSAISLLGMYLPPSSIKQLVTYIDAVIV